MQAVIATDSADSKQINNPAELPPKPMAKSPESATTRDISSVEADNIAIEQAIKKQVTVGEQVFTTLRAAETTAPMPTESQVKALEEKQALKEVEKIMMHEEIFKFDKKTGKISGVFADLDETKQTIFKKTGESIARDFASMIEKKQIDGDEIYSNLKHWLKITDTDTHWQEQVAYLIKEGILKLADQYKRDNELS